jgi:mannosyl-3-phosphoglycerate phosphatase
MKIIFTDLDGTLLDHNTYSYKKAEDALVYINENKIPLVICTSKTASEIEYWRKKIDNKHPFISENGGGIFIPKSYFHFDFMYHKKTNEYYIIELGTNYEHLMSTIKKLKNDFNIISFDDMTVEEIAEDAGLSLAHAKLAKNRDYDIPFKLINPEQEQLLINEIKKRNLHYTKGGRYYHLMGDNNKGEAVKILSYLYKKNFNENILSIGIGDSENDFSMLDAVDKAFLVKKIDGSYASESFQKADGIGPEGWAIVINNELIK